MSDILSLQTPYVDGDTVTSTNLNDLVKKATLTSAVVDGATTQLSSGAIIVRDGGITEQKLSTAAQAKLLKGAELEYPSPGDGLLGGDKTGNVLGSDSLDIQSKRTQNSEVASGDESVAVGLECTSSGGNSVALGFTAKATAENAIALGDIVTASGQASTAVGTDNLASGENSVALGGGNTASALDTVAIGYTNTASADETNAIGKECVASGTCSTAIGYQASAQSDHTVAIGHQPTAFGEGAVSVGSDNNARNVSGTDPSAGGTTGAVAMGSQNSATGVPTGSGNGNNAGMALAVGYGNNVFGDNSSAFGVENDVSASDSHAFGQNVEVSQPYSVELGYWSPSGSTRISGVKLDGDGGVSLSCANTYPPVDQGQNGDEQADELGREMYKIQRSGDAVTLYVNVGGTIKSISLGTLS
jgi:hypothetical protein